MHPARPLVESSDVSLCPTFALACGMAGASSVAFGMRGKKLGGGRRWTGRGRGPRGSPLDRGRPPPALSACRTCPRAPGVGTAPRAARAGFSALHLRAALSAARFTPAFPDRLRPKRTKKTLRKNTDGTEREGLVRGRPRRSAFFFGCGGSAPGGCIWLHGWISKAGCTPCGSPGCTSGCTHQAEQLAVLREERYPWDAADFGCESFSL